jgi:HSP20 family protein
MALVRWDPVSELAGVEIDRLNRMFSELYGGGQTRQWVPPVDIYETDDHVVVIKAELPEVKREDINVTFESNVLTLKGERKQETTRSSDGFQRTERSYGSFTRSFTLPATVDAARIAATYKDGVLTIRLPRREESKPKQISVNVD